MEEYKRVSLGLTLHHEKRLGRRGVLRLGGFSAKEPGFSLSTGPWSWLRQSSQARMDAIYPIIKTQPQAEGGGHIHVNA